MKLVEHFTLFLRAFKLVFELEPKDITYRCLETLLRTIMPYVPIYFSAKLIDALASGKPVGTLILYVSLTVGLVFLTGVLCAYLSSAKEWAMANSWRSEDWKHSEKAMSMAYESIELQEVYFLREQVEMESGNGHNLNRVRNSLEQFVSSAVSILVSLFMTGPLWIQGSIPWYIKLAMAVSILLTVVCSILTTSKVHHLEVKADEKLFPIALRTGRCDNYIDDYSTGKDIRVYGMSDDLAARMSDLSHEYYYGMVDHVNKKILIGLPNLLLTNFIRYGTYILLIFAAIQGKVSVGSIAKDVSCIMMMLDSVVALVFAVQRAGSNTPYLKRYFEYFDIPNNMYKGSLTVEKRDDREYYVEFRDVSFKYPNSDAYALRHVSVKFRIGEKLAVVGMNGSGKTTFIKLMCRLYDPTEGEILLNGVNIRKYDYDEYMSIFSVVFQDFRLFSFSLGQNVAASDKYDRARVEECLREAGFGERLAALPDGVDTCLYKDYSEDGIEISGGEAQKIALARALYKNAPFIILDEPTAALDPVAEYEVYSRFNEIVGDRTAIYISHRLASCRFCDNIVVFDHGGIVQHGSHDELMAEEGGKYRELWMAQAQYYDEEKG